jgi:UDP-glucose 4-epimerase
MINGFDSNKKVLVCGGAGYIGSHVCVKLADAGFRVAVFDNFSTGSVEAARQMVRVYENISIFEGDLVDLRSLRYVIDYFRPEIVVHMAAMKSSSESVIIPDIYYENNVVGTSNLIKAMKENGVRKVIFSSSAAVYGDKVELPIYEGHKLSPISPYGVTKVDCERIIESASTIDGMSSIVFRYFNVAGAVDSPGVARFCFSSSDIMSLICKSMGDGIEIFGGDYETEDGSAVRDYVHVDDLVRAHLLGIGYLVNNENAFVVANIGSGVGTSNIQLIREFLNISDCSIDVRYGARRDADVVKSYCYPERAFSILGWRAEKNLGQICGDHWRWFCRG